MKCNTHNDIDVFLLFPDSDVTGPLLSVQDLDRHGNPISSITMAWAARGCDVIDMSEDDNWAMERSTSDSCQ